MSDVTEYEKNAQAIAAQILRKNKSQRVRDALRAALRSDCTCTHATPHRTNPNCPLHGKRLRSDSPVSEWTADDEESFQLLKSWIEEGARPVIGDLWMTWLVDKLGLLRPASTGGERGSGWSNLRMTSEADGERDEPLEGGWAIERGVTCVVCPDCAFVFAAEHESEPNGGYSCPACAELRLEAEREGAVPVEVGQIVEHPKKKTVLLTMDRYADVESYTDAYLIPRNRDGGDDA